MLGAGGGRRRGQGPDYTPSTTRLQPSTLFTTRLHPVYHPPTPSTTRLHPVYHRLHPRAHTTTPTASLVKRRERRGSCEYEYKTRVFGAPLRALPHTHSHTRTFHNCLRPGREWRASWPASAIAKAVYLPRARTRVYFPRARSRVYFPRARWLAPAV